MIDRPVSRRRKVGTPPQAVELQPDQAVVPYDENLLERARTQWQFGDWESLTKMERDTLQHHPDRAKLALLAAAGRLQTGNGAEARQFMRLAQDWGCSKKLISQILVAGVHNSIGRAAAIGNQQHRALQHFENAITIGTPGSDAKLVTQARINHQLSQIGQPTIRLNNPHSAVPRAPTFQGQLHAEAPSLGNDVYGVLTELHETIVPKFYLEIGVGRGLSLALAKCKAVGVDPVSQERIPLGPNTHIITASSDEFFATLSDQWLTTPPDFIMIDGMPLVDYVLRDIIALEPRTLPQTLIAVPGIFPRVAESATRRRSGADWQGDIWKLPGIFRSYRPDLNLLALDVEPNGLLLITRLAPPNRILAEKRNELAHMIQQTTPPPREILQRSSAALVGDAQYTTFLQSIQACKP